VLIIGQAPGTKVHMTGIPWNDPSGDRLRSWLALDRAAFYDGSRVAIVPMGLCYPGRLPNGGDAPPRPECAPLWLDRFIRLMPDVRLTLLVGSYAQRHRLGKGAMTERVRAFRSLGPSVLPLPHPSWRTTAWERKNPWFGQELLPVLRSAVREAMDC
jgi:uracil-DNA glycosylase